MGQCRQLIFTYIITLILHYNEQERLIVYTSKLFYIVLLEIDELDFFFQFILDRLSAWGIHGA